MFHAEGFRDELRRVLDPDPGHSPPPGTTLAAVLVPLLVEGREPRLVFTRRTDTLSRHAGEISFPGGLADPGESLAAAALREAQEELGLRPSDVELLGALPPVHTRVTGILIVPFVGLLWSDPRYTPNPEEIADVLEFPLSGLREAGAERDFEHDGHRFQTFVYEIDGQVIWGATARILWSFLDAVAAAPSDREEA
jgi:8-oxo-dGTP pyrophosphatase MutT (NUDIX family)